MNRPSGIIFDCDGVLFESRSANLAYYNAILGEFGEPEVAEDDEELAHLCHTAASPQVLFTLLGDQRGKAALEYAAGLGYQQFIPYMQPEPDMSEVLSVLASRYPLAVATNRGSSMSEILRHFRLDTCFRAVVTSRDVHRPKPNPDMLFEAARRLGQDPAALLFIGDSALDRDAAAAAGMPFAAFKQDLGTSVCFKSFAEIGQFFS